MQSRETLFYKQDTVINNLPAKLYTHLFLVGLINKKQLSLYGSNNSELHLTLTVNNQTTLFPASISITMITRHPANELLGPDVFNTTTHNYTFCYKNVAQWSVVDERGKETSASNPSAYLFAEHILLKEQTDACVKTIIQAIKQFKRDEPKTKEDDACRCTMM